MKILILNWRDVKHPLSGGAELSLQKHAEYWSKKGARITWISSSAPGLKNKEMIDNIQILRMGNHFTAAISFFMYFKKNNLNDYDVVIDCFHFFPYFSKFYIKNDKIIALINEVAGRVWFANLFFPASLIGYLVEPYIIRSYKKVPFITGSNSAAFDLKKLGIKKKNIIVINHGFNKPERRAVKNQKEKNPTLLFIGRLSKDKGIEDALKMLKMAKDKKKDWKLWIVGKSESRDYEMKIKSMIKELALEKTCRLWGFVSEEDKYRLINKSNLLIHPSFKEGWGLNVIEANYLGVPAVGYNVEGLRDSIVDKKTGLLVKPNPVSLYEGVKKILEDESFYKKLSHEAKNWSSNFSWDNAGEKSWEVIMQKFKSN